MKNLIVSLTLLLPFLSFSQTTPSDENYVLQTVYQIPLNQNDVESLDNLDPENNDKKIESITYYDGLGRPNQTLGIRAGGNKQDIVTPIIYDPLGRTPKEYLPYPIAGNNAGVVFNPLADLEIFYATKYPDDDDGNGGINAYSEKSFENSPLSRVLEQGAPGDDWKIDTNSDNDHTIKFGYQTNHANDVRYYYVTFGANTESPILNVNGFYPANHLFKTETKDENWKTTDGVYGINYEYKNKLGQIVLKRSSVFDASKGIDPNFHDTYYVYDDYGNLTYVLSPEASDNIINANGTINGTVLDNLGYQYKYDYRNRLIEKKIPGKGSEYIVYNVLDQPIMTQDAVQEAKGEWTFTKYDQLGRVILTGLRCCNQSETRASLQSWANTFSQPYETREDNAIDISGVDIYYTNNILPNSTGYEILTINYYDEYKDMGTINDPGVVYGVSTATNTIGLPTVNRVRVLGTDDWAYSATFYDDKARPIYTRSVNEYLETSDVSYSQLDFTGKVLESTTIHNKTGKTAITTIDQYSYDHMGRLKNHFQQIDNEPLQLISSNVYDELGQLVAKKVGGQLWETGYAGLTNVSVVNGVISKDAGAGSSSWNAGLSTIGKIEGDGGISFSVVGAGNKFFVGLNDASVNTTVTEIDYAFQFREDSNNPGRFRIKLNNVVLPEPLDEFQPYDNGDTFSIEKEGSFVHFIHEGTIIHTQPLTSSVDLYGDTSFMTVGASIKDLEFYATNIKRYLQDVDYTYNIRGWLTDINNVGYSGRTVDTGDLFNFRINYNNVELNTGATPLYNGNIAETLWKTNNSFNGVKSYRYQYDDLNRIKDAFSYTGSDVVGLVLSNKHNLNNVTYDLNGNIKTLKRKGFDDDGVIGDYWDDLTYTYDGNQLEGVVDNTTSTLKDYGFKDDSQNSNQDYTYDANGNMETDDNKSITGITYNHLNLPTQVIVNDNGIGGTISYVYDATGVKLEKSLTDSGVNPTTNKTLYAGNYIYQQVNTNDSYLQFFNHPEGYIEPVAGTSKSVAKFNTGTGQTTYSAYSYIYQFKDHLGNVRLSYSDSDLNDVIDANSEIIEESNYYPFGLKQKGYNYLVSPNGNSIAQKYGYNDKEEQNELGLNWIDYGARNYQKDLGRWINVDPLSEDYFDNSPYNYVANTPLIAYDPDGKRIAIVGDEDYRQQIWVRLFSLALASETGAAQLNKAIQSENTLTIFDPENPDNDHGVMTNSRGKDGNKSLGFSISKENDNLDSANGRNGNELSSNASTSLGHELGHFNSKITGTLLDNNGYNSFIPANEVEAVEIENQIRKEIGMDERTHYGGLNVYGKTISQSKYQGYYELTRKKNYAQIAKENNNRKNIIRGVGIKSVTQDVGVYGYRTRRLMPSVKKPVPAKELSIEKSN